MSKSNSRPSSLKGTDGVPEEESFEDIRQTSMEQSPTSNNELNVYPSSNSSVHSLLTEFENSDMSLPDLDKAEHKNLPRALKIKHLRLLAKKRQEMIEVQKLVTHQQSLYMHLYAQIKDLEARNGVDSGDKLGKMRFLTMKGWPPHDLLMLVKENTAGSKHNGFEGELGPAILKHLRAELSSIPQEFSALAKDLMARRLKVLDFLRKRMTESKTKCEFDIETTEIQKVVSETCKNLEAKVAQSLELAETSWRDREDLIAKINRLNTDLSNIEAITHDAKKETNPVEKVPDTKSSDSSITDLKDKLNKERAARESLKHMVETAESLLRKARMRITVLERELKTTQKQMQATARKHHEYELLHRCRETSYGVRSKKLLEESKTGGETIEMLTLQRDALELRVKELQDQVKTIVADYESRESKQQATIHRLQDKTEEQAKLRLAAEARATELEKRIKEVHGDYKRLFEKSDKLIKMNSERCLDYLPRKENEPSVNETGLWKDLQATKKRLEEVTEELRQSRADKDSLLNSLAKIAQEGSETNMGNELLLREQKIFGLQQEVDELKQDIKSKTAVIAQKDRLIITLRMEASRVGYECCSKDTSQQDLSIEVLELTDRVATLTRERELLMKTAVSRTLMLERHERCAELFAKITRARHDMVALLEGRDARDRPHSESTIAEANLTSSLSPAAIKAAETFSELRSDRERILQLQDVVASQNQQLQRERRVRNQLEQRRAILERLFLNRATSTPYIPAENVATYLGASSYMANGVFDRPA